MYDTSLKKPHEILCQNWASTTYHIVYAILRTPPKGGLAGTYEDGRGSVQMVGLGNNSYENASCSRARGRVQRINQRKGPRIPREKSWRVIKSFNGEPSTLYTVRKDKHQTKKIKSGKVCKSESESASNLDHTYSKERMLTAIRTYRSPQKGWRSAPLCKCKIRRVLLSLHECPHDLRQPFL